MRAVGKQMFLEFDDDLWLRVHLGMYGAWDFAGEILVDPTIASANGRMGQTNQRGIRPSTEPILDGAGENSLTSIGAPRRARVHVRMSEQTTGLADEGDEWPPPVVGQVRLRLLTDVTCADLRGPTACELQTPDEVAATIAKLGPDPLVDDVTEGEERFTAVVRRKPTSIGLLLMDQTVVSGIGNVYRAELLFRARQNPHTPGRDVPEEVVRGHLARLGAAARDRRRDRPDDDDGRPRPRRLSRGDGEPGRPPLGVPPRRAALPRLRHRDRGRGGRHPQALLVPVLPGLTPRRRGSAAR